MRDDYLIYHRCEKCGIDGVAQPYRICFKCEHKDESVKLIEFLMKKNVERNYREKLEKNVVN